MKYFTGFVLIIITLVICLTVIAVEYTRGCAAIELKELDRRQAPILQLIPMPAEHQRSEPSSPSEPERQRDWLPNTFRTRPRHATAATSLRPTVLAGRVWIPFEAP